MQIPLHNLNPEHRKVLRSVLERKSHVVYAHPDKQPVHGVRGFLRAMSKQKKWGFGMTAFSLTSGLAIAVVILMRQTPSTQEFITAAQAAYQAEGATEGGVIHQKYIRHVEGTSADSDMTFERWLHTGDQFAYANSATFTNGYSDVYVEIDDENRTRHVYQKHPAPGATFAASNTQISNLQLGSDSTATYCTVNADDFPELQGQQARNSVIEALDKPASKTRKDILDEISTSPLVTDLGETDGVRRFRIETNSGVDYEYDFDADTYELKTQRVLQRANTLEEQAVSPYESIEEETYLVDETLDVSPQSLPIFTDFTGLTEVSVDDSGPNLDGQPTGCYDNQGNKVSDLHVEFTEDGGLMMSDIEAIHPPEDSQTPDHN